MIWVNLGIIIFVIIAATIMVRSEMRNRDDGTLNDSAVAAAKRRWRRAYKRALKSNNIAALKQLIVTGWQPYYSLGGGSSTEPPTQATVFVFLLEAQRCPELNISHIELMQSLNLQAFSATKKQRIHRMICEQCVCNKYALESYDITQFYRSGSTNLNPDTFKLREFAPNRSDRLSESLNDRANWERSWPRTAVAGSNNA